MEGTSSSKRGRSKSSATPRQTKRAKNKTPKQSSDPAQRLDLTRLFSTPQEMDKFTRSFDKRKIMAPHFMDCNEMRSLGFKFQDLIVAQGLETFVSIRDGFFASLVSAFYSNMKVEGGVLVSTLAKTRMVINSKVWDSVAGLKHEGVIVNLSELQHIEGYDRNKALLSMLQNPDDISSHSNILVGKLKVEYRMLHFAIVKIINARSSNFARISNSDIFFLWAFHNGMKIHWPHFFIKRIEEFSKLPTSPLPYACLITQFIQYFKAHTRHDGWFRVNDTYKFGKHTLSKMEIVQENEQWIYRNKENASTSGAAAAILHDDPPGTDSMEVEHEGGPQTAEPTYDSAPSWFTAAMSDLKQHVDERFRQLRDEIFQHVDDKFMEFVERLKTLENRFEPHPSNP